jgi:hypothetical protein
MSIFKETFKNFVFNQLKIREAALNQHSNRSLAGSKVPGLIGEDDGTRLPLGAFYTNTTSRQCTIRMSSGANLKEENNLIDAGDPDKLSLAKEGLAIRYILESGIQSKGQDTSEGFRPQPTVSDNNGTRYEFLGDKSVKNRDKFGSGYGSTYGDPFIRSEAADGFGIVPMPGIIDAEIRTKTAYGSLRDAKINFVCHNRRQLDVLDTLYMRPGMPILLEWGWDPYISNKGKIESYFPYLWEWFDSNSSINKINTTIHKRIKDSGGNYDGFVGFVKNFEITSRPDGGYDCTTELAAMGETLEGLKGRNDGRIIKSKDDKDITVDNLEFYLNALYNYCEMFSKHKDEVFDTFLRLSKNTLGNEDEENSLAKDTINSIKAINNNIIPLITKKTSTNLFDDENDYLNYKDNYTLDRDKSKFVTENIEYGKLDKYLLFKGEALGLKGDEGKKVNNTYGGANLSQSTEHYIKWELLVKILNKLVIDTYQESSDPRSISPITEIRYKEEGIPLRYSKYEFKNGKTVKINPRENSDDTVTLNLADLMDMSVDPAKCLLPHQIDKIITKSDGTIIDFFFGDSITKIEEGSNERNISDIFISLDYLLKLYRRTRYKGDEINEDFNLFTFLQTVWEKDINNACAGIHNFVLHTEKTRGNVVRVIDMQQDNLNPPNLYKFKINGKESIVRDFNYNTTIDNKLSATVAIAAQSPGSISDLDAVSFAALNRNIEYRFFKENISEEAKEKNQTRKWNQYTKDLEHLKKMLVFLYNYRISILKGEFKEDDETLETSTAKRYIQSIESSIISLKSRYSKNNFSVDPPEYRGFRKNDPNSITKSTIIPLKFNAQIDGIGGLVIGNIFKVDKNFLPRGYEQEDVAFAVMTENQKITAGQDWTTDFSGQLILLDLPNKNNDDIDLNLLSKQVDERENVFGAPIDNQDNLS